MERTLCYELQSKVGKVAKIEGWLHARRSMGGVTFLLIRDRSGMSQVVLDSDTPLAGCLPESVMSVMGKVVAEPRARGGVEIHDPEVSVITCVSKPLPFEINKGPLKANLDTFLDHAPVGLRHPHKQAAFRLSAAIVDSYASWMTTHGFTRIHTPKLVGSATEGGANLFKLEYFDREAYLAQSPQLYKQMMVGVFERVFEVGHVYRAEPHYTTRHLNEYVSLDMEMGFIPDHTEIMKELLEVLRSVLDEIQDRCAADLKTLQVQIPDVENVPVVDFFDAQELLTTRYGEPPNESDLTPSQERALYKWSREQGSEFVFVTGYPTGKRPFYTMPDPARPGRTNSFDLLFRGTELVTGGQRIHEYPQLLQAIQDHGYSREGFQGYLEAFRYGMPPEGGFAMGLERFTAQLVGARNLRETTLFPRDVNRLAP